MGDVPRNPLPVKIFIPRDRDAPLNVVALNMIHPDDEQVPVDFGYLSPDEAMLSTDDEAPYDIPPCNPAPGNPAPAPLPQDFNDINCVCCIGATQPSVMFMSVIAERYPRLDVVVTDFDGQLINRWNAQHHIRYEEAGVQQLVHQMMQLNLRFAHDVRQSIQDGQMIFVGVDIPIKMKGKREGFDLTSWARAIRWIVKEAQASKIIVERSTMPIDQSQSTVSALRKRRPGSVPVQFAVLYNPDFSCPGNRIEDLRHPPRVVIGVKSHVGGALPLQQLYMGMVAHPNAIRIVPEPNAVSVEIAKLATNAMVSMKLTCINAISSLCQKIRGADINIVRQIIGDDYRIENNYLTPTLGIGGPELMKDAFYMKYAFRQEGLDDEAMLINKIVQLDMDRRKEFVKSMLKNMSSLTTRRIAIFGVTYKGQVMDITRSPAIYICKALLTEGCLLRIWDPLVDAHTIQQALGHPDRVNVFDGPLPASFGAHAVVFLVPMPHVQHDFQMIFNSMSQVPGGRSLFVGCDMNVDFEHLRQMGFMVYVSGRA